MAASLTASLLIFLPLLVSAVQNITAKPGENIILPRRSNDSRPVVFVEWDRTDLGSDYVLLFRDDLIYPDVRLPSFKTRVDLQDRQMKDGDVSLVLNNVTTEDSGTYECRVAQSGERQKKLISTIYLQVSTPDQNITAEPGDSVILPCRSADSRPVVAVEWDRTDLEPDYRLFRHDETDPERQHPSFKNRVDLQDRQMKDGDVSLVLNNVTTEDSGTYECRVVFSQSNRRKRSAEKSHPLSIIYLQVPPGDKRGQTGDKRGQDGGHQDVSSAGPSGLIAALVVLAVIVLMIPAVIIVIVRRRLGLYHPPPHDEGEPGPL